MEIDVYVPRAAARAHAAVSASPASDAAQPSAQATRVVVLAKTAAPSAKALVGAVVRALAFARIAHTVSDIADEAKLAGAAGLVVFGEPLAREAGAVLPAQRQQAIAWVHAADAASLAGNAQAKRALWSELRRMLRAVRAG